jgi:hypothetical protein
MNDAEYTDTEQTIIVEWARIKRAIGQLRPRKGLPGRFPESEPYYSPRSNGERRGGLMALHANAWAGCPLTLNPDEGT